MFSQFFKKNSASDHIFGRINCPSVFFEILNLAGCNESNFKIFKNDEGNLSQTPLELNMWLLVNNTKSSVSGKLDPKVVSLAIKGTYQL